MLYNSDYFPEGGTIELNSSYTFSLTDIVGVGTDGKITVTVTEDAQEITLKVVQDHTKQVKNGKAVFTVQGLEEGIHSIRSYCPADDKYISACAVGKIKVTQNYNGDRPMRRFGK